MVFNFLPCILLPRVLQEFPPEYPYTEVFIAQVRW